MHSGIGCYAFAFISEHGERYSKVKPFSKAMKTLAQADCAAYANALFLLTQMSGLSEITEISCISDSQVAVDLLTIYKSQKHCEDIAKHWREEIQPQFTGSFHAARVSKHPIPGDKDVAELMRLSTIAMGKLHEQKEVYK